VGEMRKAIVIVGLIILSFWLKLFAQEIVWEDISRGNTDLKTVLVYPKDPRIIYIGSNNGVFKTEDGGENWRNILSIRGQNRAVNFLLFNPQDKNSLYAATGNGLFKANISYATIGQETDSILLYSKAEPDINEIQQAAIRYAEVGADKIKEWRKKAKMKAILPKLTVGLDNSKNTNYEIYTSANTRYVYEGPADNSSSWDVTLSWELGDLIWNDDQTSIDVRSRLMVQSRPLNVHAWSLL